MAPKKTKGFQVVARTMKLFRADYEIF